MTLPGCATWIKTVGEGEKIALSENEAFMFGKLVFVENGSETRRYSFWRKPFSSIFQVESEKKRFAFSWFVASLNAQQSSFRACMRSKILQSIPITASSRLLQKVSSSARVKEVIRDKSSQFSQHS